MEDPKNESLSCTHMKKKTAPEKARACERRESLQKVLLLVGSSWHNIEADVLGLMKQERSLLWQIHDPSTFCFHSPDCPRPWHAIHRHRAVANSQCSGLQPGPVRRPLRLVCHGGRLPFFCSVFLANQLFMKIRSKSHGTLTSQSLVASQPSTSSRALQSKPRASRSCRRPRTLTLRMRGERMP